VVVLRLLLKAAIVTRIFIAAAAVGALVAAYAALAPGARDAPTPQPPERSPSRSASLALRPPAPTLAAQTDGVDDEGAACDAERDPSLIGPSLAPDLSTEAARVGLEAEQRMRSSVPWEGLGDILGRSVTLDEMEAILEARHELHGAAAETRAALREAAISSEEATRARDDGRERFARRVQEVLGATDEQRDRMMALRPRARPRAADR
jgi:hypothetical protein